MGNEKFTISHIEHGRDIVTSCPNAMFSAANSPHVLSTP